MARESSDGFEKPPIEGKHYDPEGYANLEGFHSSLSAGGFINVIILILVFLSQEFDAIFFTFAISIIAWIAVSFSYNSALEKHKEKVFEAKKVEKEDLHNTAKSSEALLNTANKKLEEQMSQIEAIQKAQTIGDIIITNNHAPVVISSTITNSFNTISSNDPELASAIKTLGGFIENSGDTNAAEYFNELHEHLAQENRSPITLKALWNGIVTSLPSVEKLTDVVTKITALF